jgi:hypothetical protein
MVPENYIKRVIQFAIAGLHRNRVQHLRHRLGFGSLPHRVGPELQQLGARHRRVPARGRERRRLGPDRRKTARSPRRSRPRSVGEDRPCRLGLRRSGHPVQHHHQRLAHLPGGGEIRASNPCSEYMFLDDTACNLASLNLLQFRDRATRKFDIARYEHGVRLWTMVLEISVLMAQFPSKQIARTVLRVPHPRPRLRQYRRPADDLRHSL